MLQDMDSLTFIIPAFNDEKSIAPVIKKAAATGKTMHIPFDILVINDGSRDRTGSILTRLAKKYTNLRIITHKRNAGYGKTLKELYEKARGTWLFSLPGDYQIAPEALAKLWPKRLGADMLIGWRKTRLDSPARLKQSAIYNFLLCMLYHVDLHDSNSVRLMKTSVMKSVSLTSSSAFVDAELAIRAKRAGFTIIEIPIAHRARAGAGASGGKLKVILPTIMDMIKFFL